MSWDQYSHTYWQNVLFKCTVACVNVISRLHLISNLNTRILCMASSLTSWVFWSGLSPVWMAKKGQAISLIKPTASLLYQSRSLFIHPSNNVLSSLSHIISHHSLITYARAGRLQHTPWTDNPHGASWGQETCSGAWLRWGWGKILKIKQFMRLLFFY